MEGKKAQARCPLRGGVGLCGKPKKTGHRTYSPGCKKGHSGTDRPEKKKKESIAKERPLKKKGKRLRKKRLLREDRR